MFTRLGIAATTLAVALISGALPARAQQLVESYVARLSAQDHFNSRGVRLKSAAAIIRQDRANFHEFGRADPEDESDRFFASKSNRGLLEQFIDNGDSTRSAITAVVNGTPLIRVDIFRGRGGHFIRIHVM